MSEHGPQKVLELIQKWIVEEDRFNITTHHNPKAHFSIYMTQKAEPRTIIPMLITYPKEYSVPNTLIIGWGWKMSDIDIKAWIAIKDNRTQKIVDALRSNSARYHLQLDIDPKEKFEGVTIGKLMRLEGLTKTKFKHAIVELMSMWALLMYLFEKYNMSRPGFNLSDYV